MDAKKLKPLISDEKYEEALVRSFGIEWASISQLPMTDRLAALARVDVLQGESPQDRAWPTEGGNEPLPTPGWDPSGSFRPDVVRQVYDELVELGKIPKPELAS